MNGRYSRGIIALDAGVKSFVFFASLLEKIESWKNGQGKNSKNHKHHVLLADDDVDDRELFSEAITKINPNINLKITENGMQLMQYLQKGYLPEMIFLDLNMPGMNGKECLSEIRDHSLWKNIPVIIYSTSANKKDILETYAKGASLYLLKPTSFRDLVIVVGKAFSIDLESERVPQKDYVLSNAS